jgi:hypothetical protein
LVEEWLNRQGFFTIRGVKKGHDEMDLLAVRPQGVEVVGWHVEVTVSPRPIGYIAREPARGDGRRGSYLPPRSPEQVQKYARAWVEAKFRASGKTDLQARLWPGARWSCHLVYGVVLYTDELEAFVREGVQCHPFHELLSDLSQRGHAGFSTSAGGDLAEIIAYAAHEASTAASGRS